MKLVELIGRCADAPESAGHGEHRHAQWLRAAVFADAAGWWATAQRTHPGDGRVLPAAAQLGG